MITGPKKSRLTFEVILQRLTPYDIFKYYMGSRNWELNQATISPFPRTKGVENNPSFLIGNRGGHLHFIDFADTSKRGDCFTFVQMLYPSSSMDDVLKMIDRDFGLGISSNQNIGEYKKIQASYEQPEKKLGKRYSTIQVITRAFTREELAYWSDFYQDITDLRKEHIYSISKVYLNRKLFPMKDTDLRFGYLYNGHWKIYRPFAGKKSKWVPNNVPITTLDGKENLRKDKAASINKSKKDYMVIKKVYPYTCAVQQEGLACFSKENVTFLKENSKSQILSFDSDVVGVTNSQQITQLFDFEYCNVPRKYLPEGIKDWAELARVHGLQTVETIFKEREIL